MSPSKIALASTTLLCALSAPLADAADTGFFAGIGVGTASYPTQVDGTPSSGNGLGANLYGGYHITPDFSLEAGLAQFGRASNALGTVSAHSAYLDAVGNLPIQGKWSLLGRVGLARVDIDTSQGDDQGNAVKVGVGVEYALTDQIKLRGEADNYHVDAFGSNPNIAEYTFGARFEF